MPQRLLARRGAVDRRQRQRDLDKLRTRLRHRVDSPLRRGDVIGVRSICTHDRTSRVVADRGSAGREGGSRHAWPGVSAHRWDPAWELRIAQPPARGASRFRPAPATTVSGAAPAAPAVAPTAPPRRSRCATASPPLAELPAGAHGGRAGVLQAVRPRRRRGADRGRRARRRRSSAASWSIVPPIPPPSASPPMAARSAWSPPLSARPCS